MTKQTVAFDATRLREGRFTYIVTSDGEVLGLAVLEIRRKLDGAYWITFESEDLGQHWQSEATQEFKPIAASLQIQGSKILYQTEIHYLDGRITGTEREGETVKPVDASVKGQVVDQRVDWASMMAVEIPDGEQVVFDVFDPSTGSVA